MAMRNAVSSATSLRATSSHGLLFLRWRRSGIGPLDQREYPRSSRHSPASDAESLDQHLRDLPGRVLLLSGDETAVAHSERFEQAALNVVGAALL